MTSSYLTVDLSDTKCKFSLLVISDISLELGLLTLVKNFCRKFSSSRKLVLNLFVVIAISYRAHSHIVLSVYIHIWNVFIRISICGLAWSSDRFKARELLLLIDHSLIEYRDIHVRSWESCLLTLFAWPGFKLNPSLLNYMLANLIV